MASAQNLTENLNMKSSQMSQIRLNEERQELQIKKLEKELANAASSVKTLMTNSDNFISTKYTLEKVFREEEEFCKTLAPYDKFEKLQDSELTEIINYILKDFVASKKQMMKDLQACQSRLTATPIQVGKIAAVYKQREELYRKKIDSLQNTNMNLLRKAGPIKGNALETINQLKMRQDEHLSELKKLRETVNGQNKLVDVLQQCSTVMEDKLKDATNSEKDGDKIIAGKKGLKTNESKIIAKLTSEMAMKEKQHFGTVQKFIGQLNKYKVDVSILLC